MCALQSRATPIGSASTARLVRSVPHHFRCALLMLVVRLADSAVSLQQQQAEFSRLERTAATRLSAAQSAWAAYEELLARPFTVVVMDGLQQSQQPQSQLSLTAASTADEDKSGALQAAAAGPGWRALRQYLSAEQHARELAAAGLDRLAASIVEIAQGVCLRWLPALPVLS